MLSGSMQRWNLMVRGVADQREAQLMVARKQRVRDRARDDPPSQVTSPGSCFPHSLSIVPS